MREVWRLPVLISAGCCGALAYTLQVAFADWVYYTLLLARYKAPNAWYDFASYTILPGAIMGIVPVSVLWSLKQGEVRSADTLCRNWGWFGFTGGVIGLLWLTTESGITAWKLLTFCIWYFLGWGAPLPWAVLLLIWPHWPGLWNKFSK